MKLKSTALSCCLLLVSTTFCIPASAQRKIGASVSIQGDSPKITGGTPLSDNWSKSGPTSNIRRERFAVIRNQKEFETLWKEFQNNPELKAPEIDFKKFDVIGYFGGPKTTTGYSVAFGKIAVSKDNKSAEVEIALTKPAAGAVTGQMFTFPYTMKSVPKLPPSVTYKIVDSNPPK